MVDRIGINPGITTLTTAAPVAPAPRRPNNPSNLRTHFLRIVGEGVRFTPEDGIANFNENPFLEGTEQFIQYNALTRDRREAVERQFLKYPDVPIIQLPSKRRLSQPTLKMPFESLHDIRMRLTHGYVFVGATLFYVNDVREIEGDFLLILQDTNDQKFKCWYNKTNCIDLRTPEPQYITEDNLPGFFFRPPYKQQRQAINHDNTYVKTVGKTNPHHCHPKALVKGLSRECLVWKPVIYDLMTKARAVQSLRLSKDIAVYRNEQDQLMAEYRGRPLGEVKDDTIFCHPLDAKKNWINRDAAAVGCTLRGKE